MRYKQFIFTIPIFILLTLVSHYSNNAYGITIGNQTNNTSYPMQQYKLIGIQLSPTCLALIKNHMPTLCPTYDKLRPLDNTNPNWAGKWVNDTFYHRELPRVKNHWIMNPHTIIVMVDPDPNFTVIANMIIIQSNHFTYINPDELIGMNHTRNEYHDRFVSSCSQATVAPDLFLIEDTLHYLENGCHISAFKEKSIVQTGNEPFSMNNPYSSLYYKHQVENLKQHHLGNCINEICQIKDPYKKPNW